VRVLLLTTCVPDDRKALSCVRALGKAGCEVSVGSDCHLGEAYHSRYCRKLVRLPHPGDDPSAYRVALYEHLQGRHYDAILPTNDYTVLALVQDEERVRALAPMPVPSKDSVVRALDKLGVLELALELGLEIPRTLSVTCYRDLVKTVEEMGYPCVVKLNRGAGAMGLTHLHGPEDLGRLQTLDPSASDAVFDYQHLLVQEKIPGLIHEVGAIFCRGEPRVAFTQKRLRMYPPRGGAGIFNETTDEPDLVELALRLLKALRWHGPAQVEFLRDARDGVPRLMEVNGRLWGTVGLAVEAGIDMPTLACRLAHEGDIPSDLDYRVGARYRWPLPLGLLHTWQTGNYLRGLREFFWPAADTNSDLWLSDPRPKLAEFHFLCKRVLARSRTWLDPRERPWRSKWSR
jgi:predicted ATP-grasp superfamily ATP-dependent carboligase